MECYKVLYKDRCSHAVNPRDEMYDLKYENGSKVKAPEGSLGVFCFETLEHVDKYLEDTSRLNIQVVKVNGVGDPIRPLRICDIVSSSLSQFYHTINNPLASMNPPEGTICFQEVEVLE